MQLEEEEEDNDYDNDADDDDGWPIFKPTTYMVMVLDYIFINGSNILFMDGLRLCFMPIG